MILGVIFNIALLGTECELPPKNYLNIAEMGNL